MKVSRKIKNKLNLVSIILFVIQIVFTIPTLDDQTRPFILTVSDLKEIIQWNMLYDFFFAYMVFADHNYITNLLCIPIFIGLIVSFEETRSIYVNALILILIVFEILIFVMQWIIGPVFIGAPIFS